MLELPGRGSTYVTDTPGPRPDSPTILLLHAVGCTGLLTWYPSIRPLAERFRVVTLDQRWHGRGIKSDEFSLYDCADDAAALLDVLGIDQAILSGYSMGSIIAQRFWRQHPTRVAGLVLCATTDRFRSSPSERLFHAGMEMAMLGTRQVSRSRAAVRSARVFAEALDLDSDLHDWAMREFRSTSPWAVARRSRPSDATTPGPGSRGSTSPPRSWSPTTTRWCRPTSARRRPADPRSDRPRHRRRARLLRDGG